MAPTQDGDGRLVEIGVEIDEREGGAGVLGIELRELIFDQPLMYSDCILKAVNVDHLLEFGERSLVRVPHFFLREVLGRELGKPLEAFEAVDLFGAERIE